MDPRKYATYLSVVISPAVVGLVAAQLSLPEKDAVRTYFSSRLYAALSDEEQKLWHYSPELLASLVVNEVQTGSFTLPQEAL